MLLRPLASLLIFTVLAPVLAGCQTANPQPHATPRASAAADDAATRDMRAKLAQPISLHLEAVTLLDALAQWREQVAVEMVIHRAELTMVGGDDTPFDLSLSNTRADVVLHEMLRLSETIEPLVAVVEPGFVRVTRKREHDRHTELRVYDVRPLLAPAPQFDGKAFDMPNEAMPEGGGLFFGSSEPDGPATYEERAEALATLIRTNIAGYIHWVENGGSLYSIRHRDGLLIVQLAPHYHDDLQALLDVLLAARTTRLAVDAWMLDVPMTVVERLHRRDDSDDDTITLDDPQLDRLLRTARDGESNIHLIGSARTTLLDSQRAQISTLRQRLLARQKTETEPAFAEPVLDTFNEGSVLDVQALHLPDGTGIHLAVQASLALVEEGTGQPITTTRWQTTTGIADGATLMLVNALATNSDDPTAQPRARVLLLRVQTEAPKQP